jgi:multiple sugar transport system permease protein
MASLSKGWRRDLGAWGFVGPVVLGTLIFNVAPVLPSLVLGFTDWTGMSKPHWIGLQNYTDMVRSDVWWGSLGRTFVYMLGTVFGGYVASLALAVLVDRNLFGVKFFRTLFFAPVVTSGVAVGMTWRWLLNTNFGLVNSMLKSMGIYGPRWLGDSNLAMLSVIVVSVWHGMGYFMVIFLAGLQGIPDSLYDSADIDGASGLQKFLRITFPLLSPISFFVIVLSVINAFRTFDIIFVMTQGGPGFATSVYMFALWQEAFHFFKMGYASAMALVLFVIIASITLVQWKLSEKWVFYR